MKSVQIKSTAKLAVVLIILGLVSCRKYNSMGFTAGTGAPTITSVHTYSKTLTTVDSITITSYDTTGKVTVTTQGGPTKIIAFDSLTTAGNLGQYYLISGTNLGSAVSVSFNGVSAYFNRALITDNSIIVAIPSNTPTFGTAANDTLTIVTLYGTVKYKFHIIPPPPTITSVSDYDFFSGSTITLTGVGFTGVTKVGLSGVTDVATITSQSETSLTLKMPTSTVNRANLVLTYGGGTVTTTQEFVDVDNAYQIFVKNSLQNGWYDNSWTKASPDISTAAFKTGTSSFVITYPAGGWQVEGFATGAGPVYNSAYTYLSFWIKGGTVDHTLNIESDQAVGWGQNSVNPIVVPASVWTYFKIPLNTLGLTGWKTGTQLTSIGFFLKGQSGDVNETYYMDDVVLVK